MPYIQLPSRVRWFSRCWAVSIRSSSLLSRDASASRRKLAHLWKSSSLTTYETGRELLVTLSGYTNGASPSSWGAGTPTCRLGLHRIGGRIFHHDILNAYIDERLILVFHDHQTSAESLWGSGDEWQRQGLRMPQIRCWLTVRYFQSGKWFKWIDHFKEYHAGNKKDDAIESVGVVGSCWRVRSSLQGACKVRCKQSMQR